ncbi:phage shock protein A, PspA [[Leptolyngbya] sp. PCC 7376]|uniref:PspA/IM30 family protein n=1 Tax=[Leptolyngbya] sp. PCC 7376 TaxID=111781 RepID=UPI00029F1620|nr:PspA/IM30 family protein [[Leptolyngbya] sp. PCC 7376]AFY37289.1 phage shock protein A, PspA [[Leptolyngbya] sp. PCC 7376]
MGFLDRLGRVVKANLNDMVSKAEDPEKVLEQAVQDMGENLVQLRQSVARAIAAQKKTEQQYNKNQIEATNWQKRAELAIGKGDEALAREALVRKKTFADTAATLQQQLAQQTQQVDTLKENLIALESKIQEAKTKKDMLKARANAAKANAQLQNTMNNIDTSSAMGAFERMEDKIMELEAQSESINVLGSSNLEQQFAALEASSSVDDELAMLKAAQNPTPALTGTETADTPSEPQDSTAAEADFSEVDAELEALRAQMKNI